MLNSAYQTLTNILLTNKPVIVLINILLLVKLLEVLSSSNKYRYLTAIALTLTIILLLVFNEIKLLYIFFIVITEVTSIYLVLMITINYNVLTNVKKKVISPIILVFLLYNSSVKYYWYFNLVPIINNQQPILINLTYFQNSIFFTFTLIFILILTLVVISLLDEKNYRTNKINIFMLLKSVTNLINQVPENLNIFINNILNKWK